MAGYSRIYCMGEKGGLGGIDGINPILFQILVGDAGRQWYEVHYFDKHIKPLAGITRTIPVRPDDKNALLDACILFYPDYFSKCPSIKKVSSNLLESSHNGLLDFNLNKENIPEYWDKLRKESEPFFKKFYILEAKLNEYKKQP